MPTANADSAAIPVKKVLDKKIKDLSGNTIGEVEDIVLDKFSSNIMFAVVGFGGFLGIGEKYHPLPWSMLNYDDSDGNYIVNLSRDQLQSAPAYSIDELTTGDGEAYRAKAFEFYHNARY